jgi:hypothetical protein
LQYQTSIFQSDFPRGALVSLEVIPSSPLVLARLYLTLDSVAVYSADALIPPHEAGQALRLEARWNGLTLTRDPSPPWMSLQFWWVLTDAAGNTLTTPPQQALYSDLARRAWLSTEGLLVTVYHYNFNPQWAAYAQEIGDAAMQRLQAAYGYSLPYRPALVFYGSAGEGDADLAGGLNPPFGSFVVGRAYPGTSGVVMLARQDYPYLERTITHELAHLFQYQLGLNLFAAPHWWIEGDAKAIEPPASQERSLAYAQQAALAGNLPDLSTWDSRNYGNEQGLDHALQLGASFVMYLRAIYGQGSIAAFYQAWRGGGDFAGAFPQSFGASLAQLSQGWAGWLLNGQGLIASSQDFPTAGPPAPILPQIPPGMGRVNAYWLNFRTAPDTEAEVLALLSIGQLFLPIGRDESAEWLLVELSDGTQGWLFGEYVDYDGQVEDLVVSLY